MSKSITNSELLNLIEKEKLNAKQICEKSGISIWTLRSKHHVLVCNERKFIDIPGLFEAENIVEMKKGITISAKKLDALKCPWPQGTKFTVDINQKTKKITLTVQGD